GYIELQSSQLAVMIEAIQNLNSLEDVTKNKFRSKMLQIDGDYDTNNIYVSKHNNSDYDVTYYSPVGNVCDGDISTLYMQALERDKRFLDYIASIYYLTIASNIVTQYSSSSIDPTIVDTNLPKQDQRIRMAAYNMMSAYYDEKRSIDNLANSTLNSCQFFGEYNAPRIPGISYQTQIGFINPKEFSYDLYLAIDLQYDGGSSDIPS
ncbi:hypothetical protein AB4F11_05595, partial [Francisella philomiragia]